MAMTNLEAMKILEGIEQVSGGLPEDGSLVEEALNMAYRALAKDVCKDAVSKDAVLAVFGDVHPLDYKTQSYITKIKKLPLVIPERGE